MANGNIMTIGKKIKKMLPDSTVKFSNNLLCTKCNYHCMCNSVIKPDPELFSSDSIESDYIANNRNKSVKFI